MEYRNVTVGTVASQGKSAPGGLVVVTLHMQRSMLHVIPAGVRATETPVSFFGDPYVELVAPSRPGTARLRPGTTISALYVGQTGSLQATLGSLDNLLIKLHPGELDAALTALASGLAGNGTSLGHNLVRANTYFEQMLPLWPTVVSNLNTLVPVANQFAASTPDILQILANQTTTARTVNHQAAGVRRALSGGVSPRRRDGLAPHRHPAAIRRPVCGLGTVLERHLAEPPRDLPAPLRARRLGQRVDRGREVGPVPRPDPDRGGCQSGRPRAGRSRRTAGGQLPIRRVGARLREPPDLLVCRNVTDDTRSPTGGSISTVATAPAPVVAEPAQTRAISQIVAAVSGSAPSSPAVSTLLLSPVLEGLVTRS